MDRDGGAPPAHPVADDRQRVADERDRAADERDVRADQRDRAADARDRAADRRDRAADRRDYAADERERTADQRERTADERDDQVHGVIRELRGLVTGVQLDALEAIERSQVLLSASAERLRRTKEVVLRADARRRREQAAMARAAARSPQVAVPQPGRPASAEYTRATRTRLSATAVAFAAVEEHAARLFEQLATSHPERAGAYQDKAEQARSTAQLAREISRELTDPESGTETRP